MVDGVTPKLGLVKPEVGASRDSWGGKLNTNWDKVDNLLGEAPNDGQQYARKSLGWSVVVSGSTGVPEAPTDGAYYVRNGAAGIWGTGATKSYIDAADATKAPTVSPTFTGDPRAPTPTAGDNDTSIATTAFVTAADNAVKSQLIGSASTGMDTLGEIENYIAANITPVLGNKADIFSPTFTGDPKAPTPAAADNDTSIATTAFVKTAIAASPAGTTISDPPPSSPVNGQTWWESDTGNFYINYNDGNSSQWVQINTQPASNGFTRPVVDGNYVWNSKSDNSGVGIASLTNAGALTITGGLAGTSATFSGTLTMSFILTVKAADGAGNAHLAFANETGTIQFYNFWNRTANNLTWQYQGSTSVMTVDSAGNLTAAANVQANSGYFVSPGSALLYAQGSGSAILQAGSQQAYIRPADGYFIAPVVYANTLVQSAGNMQCAGSMRCTGQLFFGGTNTIIANDQGGHVYLRASPGDGSVQAISQTNGNFIITGSVGQKSTGTAWGNPCDARIKTVLRNYESGLDEILGLTPKVFTYKGNETPAAPGVDPAFPDAVVDKEAQTVPYKTSPHYRLAVDETECVGLVAQEAETVMPDLVSKHDAYIDGEPVDDHRILDASNVTWALVNAIKELTARVAALEAARGV
jgi:Chaperone of endosialidase